MQNYSQTAQPSPLSPPEPDDDLPRYDGGIDDLLPMWLDDRNIAAAFVAALGLLNRGTVQ